MTTSIIIPARFGSSRYRGKPLVKILGREMILRVADICKKIKNVRVFIATDSKKIANVAEKNGYDYIMTSKNCLTGTDRVAEASKKIKSEIFINVQGDEPTISPRDIQKIMNAKKKFPNHVICGYTEITKGESPKNINLPKVVVNENSDLVYISRLPIPGSKNRKDTLKYNKQVCIYGFNKKQLFKFKKFGKKRSRLESREDIEILRFFELNIPIKMIRLSSSSIAVDIKSDIKKLEKYLKKR